LSCLEESINLSPVFEHLLLADVVDQERLSEIDVFLCLVKGEVLRMPRKQAFAFRPLLHWFVQNYLMYSASVLYLKGILTSSPKIFITNSP